MATWDYAWLFSSWLHGGLHALPAVNLVSNHGFGPAAMHTREINSKFARLLTEPILFPLTHPQAVEPWAEADQFTEEIMFGGSLRQMFARIRRLQAAERRNLRMTRVRILHVIQALTRGGAARGMISAAHHSAQLAPFAHEVLSLCPGEPGALALAQAAGLTVLEQPGPEELCRGVADADIVQVHFWNTPELYAFLRMDKPAARVLIWIHVAGDHAPQIVTDELFQAADFVLASCPYTVDLPVFARRAAADQTPPAGMIWLTADFERLAGIRARPHAGFNVGYIGAVDFGKMHPA